MTPRAVFVASFAAGMMWVTGAWLDSAVAYAQAPPPPATATVHPPPFNSNGCSGFREARFFTCCFVHDLDFWAGGTWGDRRRADQTLRKCLHEVSHDWVTTGVGYMLVRLETIPGYFVKDGWGRAWYGTGRSRFAPLTPDQKRLVAEERLRVCRSLTINSKTGQYRVDDTREIRVSQARQVCGGDPPGAARGESPPT